MPSEGSTPGLSAACPQENTTDSGSKRIRTSRGRSRYGCLTCKVRRVKCDEARPSCFLCTRRGCPCEYGAQPQPPEWERNVHTFNSVSRGSTPLAESSGTGSDTTPSPGRQSFTLKDELSAEGLNFIPQGPVRMSPICSTQDSQLLRHFRSNTSKTLLPFYQGGVLVWEQEVIQLATSNDFLMHAILMTAALHLYRVDGAEEHWLLSIYHLQHTLSMFSRILQQPAVIETNADAVLATSILLIVHMAGSPPSVEPSCNPLACLIKGAHDVIQHTRRRPSSIFHRLYRKPASTISAADCRLAQDLVRMVNTTEVEEDTSLSPSQIDSPVFSVDESSRSPIGADDDGTKETENAKADIHCLTAIEHVSDILYTADAGCPLMPDRMLELILRRSSRPFLALVNARHPKALIIAAHCHGAMAISLAYHSATAGSGGPTTTGENHHDFWWMELVPRICVPALAGMLGRAWEEWMRWPLAAVERSLLGRNAGEIALENVRGGGGDNASLADASLLYPRQGFDSSAPADARRS